MAKITFKKIYILIYDLMWLPLLSINVWFYLITMYIINSTNLRIPWFYLYLNIITRAAGTQGVKNKIVAKFSGLTLVRCRQAGSCGPGQVRGLPMDAWWMLGRRHSRLREGLSGNPHLHAAQVNEFCKHTFVIPPLGNKGEYVILFCWRQSKIW